MTAMQPTRKDIAEFFRLALIAGVCEVPALVRWADSIIASEQSPPFAFFDLSTCESQPVSAIVGFLREVPGSTSTDLPVFILLAHCHSLAQSGSLALTDTLVRLHRMSEGEHFPDRVEVTLINLDEDLYLARNNIHSTVAAVELAFTGYLAHFEPYAPDSSTGIS